MDQALKARLIGAAILVALAVLVIPELLSGRKTVETQPVQTEAAPATRTFTIELGTSAETSPVAPEVNAPVTRLPEPQSAAATSGPDAPVAAPTPGVDTRSNDEPAATTQPAPSQKAVPTVRDAPVEAVAETPTPAERTASASARTWSVQVGAFGSADSARKLAAELTQSGYAAYVSATTRGGKTLHRVRVGTEPAKADAVSLASRLKARGLPATVVVND